MNRPVGASSTEVTMSANERLGKGSMRSGPTLVMFMPGMLGNGAGGSPAPTGGGPGSVAEGTPLPPCGKAGTGGGTSIGGRVSGAGLNGFVSPNGSVLGAAPGPGASGRNGGSASGPGTVTASPPGP